MGGEASVAWIDYRLNLNSIWTLMSGLGVEFEHLSGVHEQQPDYIFSSGKGQVVAIP